MPRFKETGLFSLEYVILASEDWTYEEKIMSKKIGFIGSGNMGRAIIGGLLAAGLYQPQDVLASAKSEDTVKKLKDEYSIEATTDNKAVAKEADLLFLAVKPGVFATVIPEIRDVVKKDAVIVSIAAGQTIENITSLFGRSIKLVRSMPNTPALVGEAMSAVTPNENVSEVELSEVLAVFESFGQAEVVPESMMDAVVGVSGSSPAYVYLFIEAMADAAVADGMPRAQAYKFAAQSVLGAAKMVLATGQHPGELKDAVCSPGGTTIEAVAALEEGGLRATVIDAQRACVEKSREMSKM